MNFAKKLVECSVLALSLVLAGCATSPEKKRTSFTPGTVKERIVKGVTTQTDLVKLFGSPNIVSRNKDSKEVWTYSKQSASSKAKSSLWTVIFAGERSAYSDTSTANFSLIITFDKSDVVEDYSMVSSEF